MCKNCDNCQYEDGEWEETWDNAWYIFKCSKGHDEQVENCPDFEELNQGLSSQDYDLLNKILGNYENNTFKTVKPIKFNIQLPNKCAILQKQFQIQNKIFIITKIHSIGNELNSICELTEIIQPSQS